MKELSIKEKAKRYDKVVARAKEQLDYAKAFDYDNEQVAHDIRITVYDIFPELKESEDEQIKKRIIQSLHGDVLDIEETNKAIAWLERQSEQIDIANKEYWRGYREGKQEILDKYAELEKQGEQKSIDAVEPRFHEGDFIKHNKANLICKVISVNSGSYCVENIETSCRIELFYAEQKFHLWTIEDARDGDVLVASDGSIFIYKNQRDNGVVHYVAVTPCNDFVINENDYSWERKDACHPATKEQRDLLFAKMKEAGYEWNKDKKKLIKL